MTEIDELTQKRIQTFMESMAPKQTDFLNDLEKEALGADVPIIRIQTRSLILFLLQVCKPANILEVGTAQGFSSLFMLTYAPKGTRITTIERDPLRIQEAKRNFRRADENPANLLGGKSSQIRLLEGDAETVLPQLTDAYDFIFMDAAKGQYIHFLPEVLRLLKTGGILLSDNILMDGMILESRYAVKRRDRTIHRRMREYLLELTRNPSLQTLLLQDGDGVALTYKKETAKEE